MTSAQEYRERATALLDHAANSTNATDACGYFDLAEHWIEMAQHLEAEASDQPVRPTSH
jgi:hypothetical protein